MVNSPQPAPQPRSSTIGDGFRLGCGCIGAVLFGLLLVFVILPLFGIALFAGAASK